jgi:hypothetical protein
LRRPALPTARATPVRSSRTSPSRDIRPASLKLLEIEAADIDPPSHCELGDQPAGCRQSQDRYRPALCGPTPKDASEAMGRVLA